jgi:hypothetical protein
MKGKLALQISCQKLTIDFILVKDLYQYTKVEGEESGVLQVFHI